MAFFLNTSQVIGQSIIAASTNITGDVATTLILGFMLLMVFCFATGIPLEWTAILVIPALITGMAFTSELLFFGGLLLIYLGLLFAKYYFTNR